MYSWYPGGQVAAIGLVPAVLDTIERSLGPFAARTRGADNLGRVDEAGFRQGLTHERRGQTVLVRKKAAATGHHRFLD